MLTDQEITVTGLFERHWVAMLATTVLCVVLAGLVTLLMPRRYESRMKFLVNNDRADLTITPQHNQQEPPPRQDLTEAEVNSEIELLKSHDILRGVVTAQKLYRPYLSNRQASPTPKHFERAILALEKNLNVTAVHRTNIIQVAYKSDDPEKAVAVLHTLGRLYLIGHLAAHGAPGTYEFFADQAKHYADQLQDARAQLAAFHQTASLFSMPQQRSADIDGLQATENQLKGAQVAIVEQQARLAADHKEISNLSDRMTTQVRAVPNQMAVQQLGTMLADLHNRRVTLASKFKPGDRLIKDLDQQIASTEDQLRHIQGEPATERTTDINPIRQAAESELSRGHVELDALEARRAALTTTRSAYLNELVGMDQDSIKLQQLQQAEKEAADNYDLYTRKMDEARLADRLDRAQFSNVAMIETPTASPIPVSPKLGVNLAVGGVFGFLLAIVIAFRRDSGPRSKGRDSAADVEDLYPARSFQAATGD
jgi:uncharacterized protein involved in exopolysaccharide biosynthesis